MASEAHTYHTESGVIIDCHDEAINYKNAIETIIDQLDTQRGALFASGYEYPGRYTQWDIGFINPPLVIETHGLHFSVKALNKRGLVLIEALSEIIVPSAQIIKIINKEDSIAGEISKPETHFPEEQRSKQNSIFTLLRLIIDALYSEQNKHLGLYGAFGFDLAFQFEDLQFSKQRASDQRDLVLYIPDELYIVDHRLQQAIIRRYEFTYQGHTSKGYQREGDINKFKGDTKITQRCDHKPGEYAALVGKAKDYFKRGDLFEVVPSQTFFEACPDSPATIFRRLREQNPAPYASLINLGQKEYLVGASPEMFVRVIDKRIETCPISGTIARGEDAISDANQILNLLTSHKDAAELTMCTDVDRNDKSRICVPGSVRVIGRRQIELYSRLIHTVDHVEGTLRDEFDSLDAFLTHTWVVTVTGAPKKWAMQFIEDNEKSPRRWYGGAIGILNFNRNINTGLTLRTIRIANGVAEMRVGATLLYDSDPDAEEQETKLKAEAFINAIRGIKPKSKAQERLTFLKQQAGKGKQILLVDHQDSFVHTLANYLRQTGANVTTLRSGFDDLDLLKINPDMMVLSPGPGCPNDFNVSQTIRMAVDKNIPIFGVCLGLQGIVEFFGGKLNILHYPEHGKPAMIHNLDGKLFEGLPKQFSAGRYHSLYADKASLPKELTITAETANGIIMAVEHEKLPISAVQFHPESILSRELDAGLRIIHNVMAMV